MYEQSFSLSLSVALSNAKQVQVNEANANEFLAEMTGLLDAYHSPTSPTPTSPLSTLTCRL